MDFWMQAVLFVFLIISGWETLSFPNWCKGNQRKPKENNILISPKPANPKKSKEVRGSAGKCGEVRGSAGKCGEPSPGKCGEVRGSAGTANSTNNNVE